jgi:octaprenyl-diphosphate synthase
MAFQSQQSAHSDDTITEISHFLADDLHQVEGILRSMLESESSLIREIGDYICLASGKKLRPMLTLLVSRAFGSSMTSPVEVAAAVEAVHVATLLHDDVIDKARLRRGKPSVNARWGDDVAILMADFLYAGSFELALHHLDPEPLKLICEVTRRMCEGEMFQIEHRGKWMTPDDYLYVISCKTAHLFSASAAMGGLTGGLAIEDIARISSFGLDFGLAFQVTDDTLDFTADHNQWGKSVGIDLMSGRQSLPIILTLRDASEEDRKILADILSEGLNFNLLNDLIQKYHAIENSLEVARNYMSQCMACLEGLELRDSEAWEFLHALPDYVLGRQY